MGRLLLFSFLVSMTARADVVRMTLKVEFAKGASQVEPRYREQVEQVAAFLKKYPNTTAVIEGHSDNIGSDRLNQKLSERRAHSVRNMLIGDFAIGPSRLTVVGYGKQRPVAPNDTEEGRFKNRRVVARVEGGVDELKDEKKEIDVAKEVEAHKPVVEAPKVAPPKVVAAPPHRVWKRALAGPFYRSTGLGFSVDWNPIIHRERGVTFEGLLGFLYEKGRSGAGYLSLELGYSVSWQPIPNHLELNAGAALSQLTADTSGICFSLYAGVAWYHHLLPESFPYFDRLVFAYTPILVRNANRQVLRLSLGFTF